jgi:hypothetical protein
MSLSLELSRLNFVEILLKTVLEKLIAKILRQQQGLFLPLMS